MQSFLRLLLAAFCTDLALYLIMLSLPFRALEHGASPMILGLVPVLYALPYSLVALTAGHFSDRWPRRVPIRMGLAIAIGGVLSLSRTDSLVPMLASVPLLGIGLGFFWPSLQAGFSELRTGRGLDKSVGWLNVAWSLGKGLGMILGGALLLRLGPSHLSELAALALLVSALALPWMARPGDHSPALEEDPLLPSDAVRLGFLRAAWLINGVTFGVAATFNHHLPRGFLEQGRGSEGLGLFLGVLFFAQTLTFATVGRRDGWHFRRAYLLAVPMAMALGALVVPRLSSMPLLLLLALGLGLAAGFAYQSSIYYSLHAPRARGRQAGVHEATLGVASASIPLLGGWAVSSVGAHAPFFVAAGASAICFLVSLWLLARTRDLSSG